MNTRILLPLAAAMASLLLLSGCEDHGDGNRTTGTIVCIGDSLTAGIHCIGAPYPSRLQGLTGRPVVNMGVGGANSGDGVGAVSRALARNPGVVCVLYGSNDPGDGIPVSRTVANIRKIVAACQARGVPVVVGTPPPTMDPHVNRNDHHADASRQIKELAKEKGVSVVDINAAVGADPHRYLNPEDGLHLSNEGGTLFARLFSEKL